MFGFLILLQSISFGVELGLEGENNGSGLLERLGPVLYVLAFIELIFLIVFSIEYSLRCQALGRKYCFAASGVFDAVVLIATLAHTVVYFLEASSENTSNSSLQTARTFRLLRIIRLLQTFPALAMLVKGLFSTFIAILDVMILLTALCYAGALFCCELLGSSQDNNSNTGLFSGVFQGFLTHIQLVLIEAWPDIAAEMMLQSYIWGVYVVGFLLVSNFAVLNVVTGVICERVLLIASNQPPGSMEDAQENLAQLQERISMLCSDVMGKTPDISKEELLELLQSAQALEILKAMKVALPQTAEDVTIIFDKDHVGAINCDELQEGLMRLRGSSHDLLSLNSHCGVYKTFWSSNEALQNAAARQRRCMRETRRAMTERMAEALPWPRPRHPQGSQDRAENVDLTAITAAMHQLRTSLQELQKQCSLHYGEGQESTSNLSIATQTETHEWAACILADSFVNAMRLAISYGHKAVERAEEPTARYLRSVAIAFCSCSLVQAQLV
ncbi:Cacna1f [Symbiodinium necroappetens]|uniref:Cacna1f protein n=1 Tax=Symbiodinium necroappetens TaxID=1628268 RepID=A0A813CL47_9DINO|nr:Cacna1f [Symbiodinium necroappetens]